MRVEIRAAEGRDPDEVRSVALTAHSMYEETLSPGDWERMKRGVSSVVEVAAEGTLLVAEVEDEVVGAVVYLPPGSLRPEIFEREWAVVRMLSVSPSYRGQGIGRMLSEECISRAERDGAETIALHTGEMMVAARKIYESLGFEVARDRASLRVPVLALFKRTLNAARNHAGGGGHPRSSATSREAMDRSCSRLVTSRASCSMQMVS